MPISVEKSWHLATIEPSPVSNGRANDYLACSLTLQATVIGIIR
jgi:hypothetical protein